jgi:hypothetical protein
VCVDENVCTWMWDRTLRKTAYVPLSKRIRSKRSSKCGKCYVGVESSLSETAYVPLSWRIKFERSSKLWSE